MIPNFVYVFFFFFENIDTICENVLVTEMIKFLKDKDKEK